MLAATHIALEERIAEGRFREDLFFRLNVVTIEVPSLAERKEDIVELLGAFIADLPRKLAFTESDVLVGMAEALVYWTRMMSAWQT